MGNELYRDTNSFSHAAQEPHRGAFTSHKVRNKVRLSSGSWKFQDIDLLDEFADDITAREELSLGRRLYLNLKPCNYGTHTGRSSAHRIQSWKTRSTRLCTKDHSTCFHGGKMVIVVLEVLMLAERRRLCGGQLIRIPNQNRYFEYLVCNVLNTFLKHRYLELI